MQNILIFIFFHGITFLLYALAPVFQPPPNWEIVFPEHLSQFIQVGFLGNGSTPFRPSINLAVEEVDVNLKQYLKAVQEIHLAQPNTTWRDLGKFHTGAGEGRLTEITTLSPIGQVKILQMILVKEKTAYILTGAVIKEEFLGTQALLTKAFQSFNLFPDLLALLPQERRQQFENILSCNSLETRDAKWNALQKKVLEETSDMGSYWQFSFLKECRKKLYNFLNNSN